MSEYVVMPASDWQGICDATRSKTGTTDLLKSGEVAEAIEGIQTGGGEDLLVARITNTLTHYENAEVTGVTNYAFYGCSELLSVRFPSATMIGSNAFYMCRKLATVHFPKASLMYYGAFRDCIALTEFVTGTLQKPSAGNVEAFSGCKALKKADFALDIMQARFFNNCTALDTLIIRNTDTMCTLADTTTCLHNTPIASGTGYIYVPAALIEEYKAATNWTTYADQIRAIEDYPDVCGEVSA